MALAGQKEVDFLHVAIWPVLKQKTPFSARNSHLLLGLGCGSFLESSIFGKKREITSLSKIQALAQGRRQFLWRPRMIRKRNCAARPCSFP